jgi:hypothetical protein
MHVHVAVIASYHLLRVPPHPKLYVILDFLNVLKTFAYVLYV